MFALYFSPGCSLSMRLLKPGRHSPLPDAEALVGSLEGVSSLRELSVTMLDDAYLSCLRAPTSITVSTLTRNPAPVPAMCGESPPQPPPYDTLRCTNLTQ